jgi:hypothetical protein
MTTKIFTGKPKTIVEPVQDNEPRGTYDPKSSFQNISFSGADAVATMIIPVIGEDGKITSDGDVIELGSSIKIIGKITMSVRGEHGL